MFRRILMPTDGSAASMVAVDAAIGLARGSGARVVGLHVTPYLVGPGGENAAAAPGQADELARQSLGYVARRAAEAQVDAEVLTRRADAPSEAILAAARDCHCDLIVMATHGRGVRHATLPGSQTAAVLAHSSIPVLVVPPSPALAS